MDTTPNTQKTTTMSKSLIFDTETTGLFPRYDDAFAYPVDPLEDVPHLMELCFVLVDDTTGEIEESYNEYVQIPDDAIVSEGALKVHKITKQKTKNEGVSLGEACVAFMNAYKKANVMVGHNLVFDIKIMKASFVRLIRLYENEFINYLKHASSFETMVAYMQQMDIPICLEGNNMVLQKDHLLTLGQSFNVRDLHFYRSQPVCPSEIKSFKIDKPVYDTMLKGKEYCNITLPPASARHKPRIKNPSLLELYTKLYPDEPLDSSKLHTALYDVEITSKCYLKMKTMLLF